MLKKTAALVTALCVFLTFATVLAQETNQTMLQARLSMSTNPETGAVTQNITIWGQLPDAFAGAKYVMALIRPDVNETEEELDDYSKYAMIYQDYVKEDGSFQYEFPFRDSYGQYQVRVMADCLKTPLSAFLYVPSVQEISDLMVGLKNKTLTKEMLLAVLDEKGTEIALDTSIFQLLTNNVRKEVCGYIIENIEEYTVECFYECFERAVLLKGTDLSSDGKMLKRILLQYNDSYLQLDRNPLYENFQKLSTAQQDAVYAGMTAFEYEDIPSIRDGFCRSLALVDFKSVTSYNQIGSLMEKYRDYLNMEAEQDQFDSFDRDKKTAVQQYVVKQLTGINSLETLSAKLKYAITHVESLINKGSESVSSGGGRGSSSVGVNTGVTAPPVSLDEITQNHSEKIFVDVAENFWAYKPIYELSQRKILSGKEANKFYPEDSITRAEFTKLIVSAFDLVREDAHSAFSDVAENTWEYKYVSSGVQAGIVQGISDDLFGPEEFVTRQDAAVLLYRTAVCKEIELANYRTMELSDFDETSDYARQAVQALYECGWINGYADQTFRPLDTISRAEAAQLIYQVLTEGSVSE